jgi:hypothetical protein
MSAFIPSTLNSPRQSVPRPGAGPLGAPARSRSPTTWPPGTSSRALSRSARVLRARVRLDSAAATHRRSPMARRRWRWDVAPRAALSGLRDKPVCTVAIHAPAHTRFHTPYQPYSRSDSVRTRSARAGDQVFFSQPWPTAHPRRFDTQPNQSCTGASWSSAAGSSAAVTDAESEQCDRATRRNPRPPTCVPLPVRSCWLMPMRRDAARTQAEQARRRLSPASPSFPPYDIMDHTYRIMAL